MNLELRDIAFCDKTVSNICSDSYKERILSKINDIDQSILTTTNTILDDKNNISNITNQQHLLSVHSNGNTYYLYLFKDRYNVCTMIDHKKIEGYLHPRILIIPLRMDESLYTGTLFKGELIKNHKNKWIFLINDVLIYENKSITDMVCIDRLKLAYRLLNKYYIDDPWVNPCILKMKCYYTYTEIDRFIKNHIKNIDYSIDGILLTPNSKYKSSIHIPSKPIETEEIHNKDLIPIFGIKKTRKSGIYQLYCYKNNEMIKHSIARIPNLNINQFLQNLCKNYDDVYNVECSYDKIFNKWIPVKQSYKDIIQFSEIVNLK